MGPVCPWSLGDDIEWGSTMSWTVLTLSHTKAISLLIRQSSKVLEALPDVPV